jgi:hypothetical protein
MSFDMTPMDVIQANKAIPAVPDASLETGLSRKAGPARKAGLAGKAEQASTAGKKKMKLQFKECDQYCSQVRAHTLRYFCAYI